MKALGQQLRISRIADLCHAILLWLPFNRKSDV
jgi:hypothetical protein